MILQVPLFSLRHGTADGLASCVANLIAGIATTGTSIRLAISSSDRLNPEFLRWIRQQPNVVVEKYPYVKGGTWTRFLEETVFFNSETSVDPIIFPNYFLPPAVRGRAAPLFPYIHDCQHRVFPQYFSRSKRVWLDLNFKRTLENAARVLLISEFERRQIARFYGEKRAENCTVVYNPVDWDRYTRGPVSAQVQAYASKQFVLTVSHQYVHKHTEKIVDAFALLAEKFPDLHLVLVGRESRNVIDRIAAIGSPEVRSRVFLTGFISDADLGCLYANCRLFVHASEYEGFGMPAVEAMGFGAPVVVANGTSLPEVTLGKAVYVEAASNADVWSDALAEQLRRPKDEEFLSRAAAAVRAKFQPRAVAKSVLDCIAKFA